MARIDNLSNFLSDVATAIKDKTGKTDTITPANFDTEISSIQSGGGENRPPKSGFVATEWYYNGNGQNDGLPTKGLWYGVKVPDDCFHTEAGASYIYGGPFGYLKEITFLDKVTAIGKQAFYSCRGLKTITFSDTLDTIGKKAFYDCRFIENDIIFPASLQRINSNAFYNCSKIKKVTFEGNNLKTLESDAFTRCNALETINVPWAEGEVANAPWGATNATINYNYVEGEN